MDEYKSAQLLLMNDRYFEERDRYFERIPGRKSNYRTATSMTEFFSEQVLDDYRPNSFRRV